MPLGPSVCRQFWRLYSNNQDLPLVTITYRKRGLNQSQGTTTDYTLYNCREKKNYRSGQTIEADMTSNNHTVWQIPQESLDNAGVPGVPNILDQIIESNGNIWDVEDPNTITEQLFGVCWNLDCRRLR